MMQGWVALQKILRAVETVSSATLASDEMYSFKENTIAKHKRDNTLTFSVENKTNLRSQLVAIFLQRRLVGKGLWGGDFASVPRKSQNHMIFCCDCGSSTLLPQTQNTGKPASSTSFSTFYPLLSYPPTGLKYTPPLSKPHLRPQPYPSPLPPNLTTPNKHPNKTCSTQDAPNILN